jgi:hypothetical protein
VAFILNTFHWCGGISGQETRQNRNWRNEKVQNNFWRIIYERKN